jgi:protein-disulfide isomerase
VPFVGVLLRALAPCLLLALTACPKTEPQAGETSAAKSGEGKPQTRDGGDGGDGEADAATPPAKDLIREAPGVDLSKLPEAKRESFYEVINTEASACGKPHSLAVSLRDDDACRDSMHVAQFIADRLAAGAQPADIKLEIDQLIKALAPRKIPTEGRPVYGNERAPVTLVVFADFQCPVCKAEAPELRAAIDEHKGRAKLVFKHFPLTHVHPRADVVARAAEAAGLQGKFWEMHDKLFAHQEQVEDADLESYAEQIGLDVEQWKADMESEAVKQAVAQDRSHGEAAGLQGTPTVYIDGREVVPLLWGGELDAWIEDALRRG